MSSAMLSDPMPMTHPAACNSRTGAAAPLRAAMAALLAILTPVWPSNAISAEVTYRQWAATRSGPRKSLAKR